MDKKEEGMRLWMGQKKGMGVDRSMRRSEVRVYEREREEEKKNEKKTWRIRGQEKEEKEVDGRGRE